MQGQLFTQDFLSRGILDTPPYQAIVSGGFENFRAALAGIYAGYGAGSTLNEAQTESLIIEKVLFELGWGDDYLPQVNLSKKRREDVPDCLLFADPEAKRKALTESSDTLRYRHGLAILESKRWLRSLDRGDDSEPLSPGAPSSQMLRYLSRADVVSDRAIKWGILTNGAVWRLYWQDARSRAEEYFEIDVAAALGVPGVQRELDAPEPEHALVLFFLMFHRAAFLAQTWDDVNRSFHAYARNEARVYEEKVSNDLGARVFSEVFPQLAGALARGDLQAQTQSVGVGKDQRSQFTRGYLNEVREAALILLYRLLFLFYAEDRNLLPVRDARYAAYSVRGLRERVRDDIDAGKNFSSKIDRLWRELQNVFTLIDQGDDAVGMPAYNGGLFDRRRAPLLERTKVPDAVMAPIIDALSRRTEDMLRAWINYRDLSVAHLGGIYERLLEYTLEHEVQAGDSFGTPEIDRIVARPASFARKVSGSYYTHDDLVRLLLRETVGLYATEINKALDTRLKSWREKEKTSLNPADWDTLDKLDPASRLLDLTICDPAMGSGHFLVSLVDDLADRILEAVNFAEHLVNEQPWAAHLVEQNRPWQSPLVARLASLRRDIKQTAKAHGWNVSDAQLDDRHLVRRMILKKCVFGVDKNPMAVELAKTALWLHTFTVGAPLSFLDHHLKCGDSLHGEKLDAVQRNLSDLGMLFQQSDLQRLDLAAKSLGQISDLTDIDIAEAHLSKRLGAEAEEQLAPLRALLDFWRALRWLIPGWPAESARKLSRLGDNRLARALSEILSPQRNLIALLASGRIDGSGEAVDAANELLAESRLLAEREGFFHWWTAFPTVFGSKRGGFDVIIGNPPWDRIKLQEVEWFAERHGAIAQQARASDRKRMIAELKRRGAPLWREYEEAMQRAEANMRVLGKSGDYPLLGGGDINLYSLFVERAQGLVAKDGLIGLLTPSGIAADKGAAAFFRNVSAGARLSALFDFENRNNPGGSYFPDVDSRFKFSAMIFGGESRAFKSSRCAFYLHTLDELTNKNRVLELRASDFTLVNPNTGAAPVFRNKRDAEIVTRIYRNFPVLVSYSENLEKRAWPVKFRAMFHMTNDSRLFLTHRELEKHGFVQISLNRWQFGDEMALPLYEGKMVQMYDHRAADVVINSGNLHRAAQPQPIPVKLKEQFDRYPVPQYFVRAEDVVVNSFDWALGFKEITAPTNTRTMISALLPRAGFSNKLPLLLPQAEDSGDAARIAAMLLANLNSFAFDFVLRTKLQGQTINLFILEQLPVIAPEAFQNEIDGRRIQDFVCNEVLRLSYTAYDLAPFARDLGYDGPPFRWSERDRMQRMAALDALFMHLYGLDADDASYILDSFPSVREQDVVDHGGYLTKALVLAGMERLAANQWPDLPAE